MPPIGNNRQMMVLMFTDVEGSVKYKNRYGDEVYAAILRRHNDLFLKIIADYEGAEIRNQTGDGFLVRFERNSDAVLAALRFQHALTQLPNDHQPIKTRIAIHRGEVIVEQELEVTTGKPRLVGTAVDLTSRLLGAALGGQI